MAISTGGRVKFIPYNSIPASLDDTTAVYVQRPYNMEVFFQVTGAAGTYKVWLLKWIKESDMGGGWYPYRHPVEVDPSINDGKCNAVWLNDIYASSYFQLLVDPALTVVEAMIQAVRY